MNQLSADEIVEMAKKIIKRRFVRGRVLSSPTTVRDYFAIHTADLEHEVFHVVFLDNQHQVLDHQPMFRGTIDGASVYPREVVKEAIRLNAGAVIFQHNHPSGVAEPSSADERITQRLKDALALVDIRVLDHFITGGGECYSFAENGKI